MGETLLRLDLAGAGDERHVLLEFGAKAIIDPMGCRLLALVQVIK